MNYKKFLAAASAALMIVIVITLVLAPSAWAQTNYKTLYKFTGGADGWDPYMGSLILDKAGNLYGMTYLGGTYNRGTVFELTPNSDGSWTEGVLHSFCSLAGCSDGAYPYAGLILDEAGNLYGTTTEGGNAKTGTVFKVMPNSDGSWTESVLYSFCSLAGCSDGKVPEGGLVFDQAGNLYGAGGGGTYGNGVVFELLPNQDGSWRESVLYDFRGGGWDGSDPWAGLTFDKAGNLYGTTSYGGAHGYGNVFELMPNQDGSWKEKVLHQFTGGKDGTYPVASLIFDRAGNLYSTTGGGAYGYGNVFELMPNQDGSWKEKVLHQFTGGKDGNGGNGGVIFDNAGNLYGTTGGGGNLSYCDGGGCGVVFKLTPNSKGGWTEKVLHRFVDRPGANPDAGVIFDAKGKLYGTTNGDGTKTVGSVFEITP